MKILYFTATGNSLYIAKSLGGDLHSIPQMVKEEKYDFTDDKIGIVFPLHAWGVPSYVVEFLERASFNCNYLFAITTYGIYSGAVAKHLSDIASEAGYKFDYINRIKMVDNYVPTFDMKKEVGKEAKKEIEKHISMIKSDIDECKKSTLRESIIRKVTFKYMSNREGRPFNEKRLKVHVYGEGIDNYLKLEDNCTACGVCVKVCPVDNIKLDKEACKIELSDKCFMCLACLHNCPSNTIHINGEVSKDRYINKNIKLKEIIDANK